AEIQHVEKDNQIGGQVDEHVEARRRGARGDQDCATGKNRGNRDRGRKQPGANWFHPLTATAVTGMSKHRRLARAAALSPGRRSNSCSSASSRSGASSPA